MLLLSVPRLRERIGGPTADHRLSAPIEDVDLQAILDEEWSALLGYVLAQARNGFLSGLDLLKAEPVIVHAEPSGYYPGLYDAKIPDLYFPFAFRLVDVDGEESTYDIDTIQYRRSPFRRFRHFVEGRVVSFTYPYSTEADDTAGSSVTLVLATEDAVVSALASEKLAEANERAVQRAAAMLARKIAEQTRLEETIV